MLNPLDYAIFQDHGYKGLYGGLTSKDIHLGSTELAANLFRATQAEDKLKRDNVKNKHVANQTHFEVGQKVRETIIEIGGTMPENLPTEESIKKIERKSQKKRR